MQNLTLRDYKKIRTPFVFFDETGSINDRNNRYFGLGMVKCMQPYYLDSKIRYIRQKNLFYDEIKWNRISKKNLPLIKEIIDATFDIPGIKFASIIINKDDVDFKSEFSNDPYLAYQKFTEDLLKINVAKNEVLTVLADYISTPNGTKFEVKIKHNINEEFGRLAIAGVHRVESDGINLIQIADLLLGAVIYEHKLKHKLVSGDKYKIATYKHVLKRVGIKTFVKGHKNRKFNVIEYK